MKEYKTCLTRKYHVTIHAESEKEAVMLSEFWLGDCPDKSNAFDRRIERFNIDEIELIYNEAEVLEDE